MLYDFLTVEKPVSMGEIEGLLKRDPDFGIEVTGAVLKILSDIKTGGDEALLGYCRKYDGINAAGMDDIIVDRDEIEEAGSRVEKKYPEFVESVKAAQKNIIKYHREQFRHEPKTWFVQFTPGKKLGQILTPLERVGLYVPGGRYLYPSSVLMCAIPAKLVKVGEIVVCTPPQKDGKISDVLLYVFNLLKIYEVYKIGGAQAIGALAYGTESIKKVDKIAGPGNIYVAAAKKLVFGSVGIDSLAGPSEIVIIADGTAKPGYIAADLLAQAEHDPDAGCVLLSCSARLAEKVIAEIYNQLERLKNSYGDRVNLEVMANTLEKKCKVFFNPSIEFLTDACNLIAPEHLEIMVADCSSVLKKIKNAGAIFLGDYSPVAAGDYVCGTNHVIPTGGNARFSSPLGVYDFCKKSSVASYSREILRKEAKHIEAFSDYENLSAHSNSIKIRFEKDRKNEH